MRQRHADGYGHPAMPHVRRGCHLRAERVCEIRPEEYGEKKSMIEKIGICETKTCPKCKGLMKKWFLLGGDARWECVYCKYREEEK